MSDFDPTDDQLGAALRRRAGGGSISTDAAHDAVVRRAGTIRRRRAAIGGGGVMAVLLIGSIALLPRGADEIGPMDDGDVLPTVDEATGRTTSVPEREESPSPGPITVDPTLPRPTTTAGPTTTSPATNTDAPDTTESPGTTDTPTSAAPDTSTPSTSTPDTSAPDTSTPSTSTPDTSAPSTSDVASVLAPFTDTYQSIGGSITVAWDGSTLVLQSIAPADGFVAEVEQSSSTRVRVGFEGADVDSRIEVRVDDGVLSVDVD